MNVRKNFLIWMSQMSSMSEPIKTTNLPGVVLTYKGSTHKYLRCCTGYYSLGPYDLFVLPLPQSFKLVESLIVLGSNFPQF